MFCEAEEQGTMLGLDCFAFHYFTDRTAAQLSFLLPVRIGYNIVPEK